MKLVRYTEETLQKAPIVLDYKYVASMNLSLEAKGLLAIAAMKKYEIHGFMAEDLLPYCCDLEHAKELLKELTMAGAITMREE